MARGRKKAIPAVLPREEILRQIAEIEALEADIAKKEEEAKASNPFWFFEPSTGDITPERMDFLRKHIDEEDLPQILDSQMDVIMSRASIKAAFGGNRAGKSVVGAVLAFMKATGEVPLALEDIYPKGWRRTDFNYCFKIRVIGVDHKTLLNTVLPTYKQWCPKEWLKKGSWPESYISEQRTLFLYRGGKGEPIASVEFMTNQQDDDSFQGPDIHFLVYDEEPKESIHKENLLRFGTAKKLDVLFCMTPTNGMTWVADIFFGEMDKTRQGQNIESFKLTSVTNKRVNIEVLEEIVQGLDSYEEKKMRLLGEFVSLSGLVYGKLFDKRIHVISPFFEGLNPTQKQDYLLITGMDPHTVTPTAMVFVLLDREGIIYVDRCWHRNGDTEEIRKAWHEIVKDNGYRKGWVVADRSSDSSIMAFGGRNIFKELSRGVNAIPAMRSSEKYEGSIKAGVDDIKKRLKLDPKPRLYVVDRPENKVLINSFRTLERDTYANEDVNGPKDRIKEGKHHLHSALRFIHQFPLNWYPAVDVVPQPEYGDEAVCW